MSEISEKTSGFVKELGEAARRNPLSAALIGMGVLWLLADGKSAGRAGDLLRSTGLDRAPEIAKDTFASMRSGIDSGASSVRDAAGSSVDVMRERGAQIVNQTTDFAKTISHGGRVFEAARDNLTELFRAQPLALGVVGLAIGAGIAAAFPATDVEDAYMGEVSDTVRSKTAEVAGEQIERATTLATNVIDAATEEAQKQGLTPEGASAAVGEIAERMGRVVDAARSGASNMLGS